MQKNNIISSTIISLALLLCILFSVNLQSMNQNNSCSITFFSPLGNELKFSNISKNISIEQLLENSLVYLKKENNFFTTDQLNFYWYDMSILTIRTIPFLNVEKNREFIKNAHDETIIISLKDPETFFTKTNIYPRHFEIPVTNLVHGRITKNDDNKITLRLDSHENVKNNITELKKILKNISLKSIYNEKTTKTLKNTIRNGAILFSYTDTTLKKPIILDENDTNTLIKNFVKIDKNPSLEVIYKKKCTQSLNKKRKEAPEAEEDISKKQKTN